MKIPKFWNSDKFLSLSAILISFATFATLIYQTRIFQKQQYASVLPYLEIWNSNPTDSKYRLLLINNGIGPAFIKDIKIHFQGKQYNYDPSTFYGNVIFPKDTIRFISSNIVKGQLIPAGEEIEMVLVENSVEDVRKMRKLFGNQRAKIEVVYSSVYEEQWRIVGMGNAPVKLDD